MEIVEIAVLAILAYVFFIGIAIIMIINNETSTLKDSIDTLKLLGQIILYGSITIIVLTLGYLGFLVRKGRPVGELIQSPLIYIPIILCLVNIFVIGSTITGITSNTLVNDDIKLKQLNKLGVSVLSVALVLISLVVPSLLKFRIDVSNMIKTTEG